MTESVNKAGWASVVVSCLMLGGVGIGMYADLKSDIAVGNSRYENIREEVKKLDAYDAFLQRQYEEQKERLLKTEANQEGIEKNQERIERTMEQLLEEVKRMNENLIKLGERK